MSSMLYQASYGAGVAIVRMVDPELTRSMVDYVLLAVLAQLREHLGGLLG